MAKRNLYIIASSARSAGLPSGHPVKSSTLFSPYTVSAPRGYDRYAGRSDLSIPDLQVGSTISALFWDAHLDIIPDTFPKSLPTPSSIHLQQRLYFIDPFHFPSWDSRAIFWDSAESRLYHILHIGNALFYCFLSCVQGIIDLGECCWGDKVMIDGDTLLISLLSSYYQ